MWLLISSADRDSIRLSIPLALHQSSQTEIPQLVLLLVFLGILEFILASNSVSVSNVNLLAGRGWFATGLAGSSWLGTGTGGSGWLGTGTGGSGCTVCSGGSGWLGTGGSGCWIVDSGGGGWLGTGAGGSGWFGMKSVAIGFVKKGVQNIVSYKFAQAKKLSVNSCEDVVLTIRFHFIAGCEENVLLCNFLY